MAGLQRILKQTGKVKVVGFKGASVTWVWDYQQDKPRIESEMSKEEKELSDKAKIELINRKNK
jgi:hypothetical protein